jgi:hypothetical protein
MGCRQYAPSSNATPLESKKSARLTASMMNSARSMRVARRLARGEHEGLVGPGREDVRVVVTRARDPAVATREQCKDRS